MHRLLDIHDENAPRRSRLDLVNVVSYCVFGAIVFLTLFSVDWEFASELDFSAVWPYRVALARGLGLTLLISVAAIGIGLSLGTTFAILLQAPIGLFRWLILAYVEVARNTPLIVQLFWIHFALPYVTGISTSAVQSGFIAIGFQASGYLTDIARAGVQAIPKGQFDACHALGLPTRTKWSTVILPQALKIVIPTLANVSISYFKASAILSVLSVGELMSMALRVSDANFKPIETITFVGLVYIVLGIIFSRATQRLEVLTNTTDR